VVSLITAACSRSEDDGTPWARGPDAPLSARSSAQVFWTGDEAIVMGGIAGASCPHLEDCSDRAVLQDGAAYDPAADVWRPIPPSPLPLSSISAVHDGVVYHVFGDPASKDAFVGFGSYDPDADLWEDLPIPAGPPLQGLLTSAGETLVLYQFGREDNSVPDLSYNVQQQVWTELPADPIGRAFNRTMIWTGTDLVLFASKSADQTFVFDAAMYSPPSQSWRSYPSSTIDSSSPTWFWAGGRAVNPSTGVSQGRSGGRPLGGTFNPEIGTWGSLPPAPEMPGQLLGFSAASNELLLNTNGLILDPDAGRWTTITSPLPVPTDGGAAVVTDSQVIIWTGVIADGDQTGLNNSLWTLTIGQ